MFFTPVKPLKYRPAGSAALLPLKTAISATATLFLSGREKFGVLLLLQLHFLFSKKNHKLSTSYGAIQSELSQKGITQPTPLEVAQAVIAIRQSKLPDPKVLGNSGSFFQRIP